MITILNISFNFSNIKNYTLIGESGVILLFSISEFVDVVVCSFIFVVVVVVDSEESKATQ